jgi:hypothetical protein
MKPFLKHDANQVLECHGPGTILPDWAYDKLCDWFSEKTIPQPVAPAQSGGADLPPLSIAPRYLPETPTEVEE